MYHGGREPGRRFPVRDERASIAAARCFRSQTGAGTRALPGPGESLLAASAPRPAVCRGTTRGERRQRHARPPCASAHRPCRRLQPSHCDSAVPTACPDPPSRTSRTVAPAWRAAVPAGRSAASADMPARRPGDSSRTLDESSPATADASDRGRWPMRSSWRPLRTPARTPCARPSTMPRRFGSRTYATRRVEPLVRPRYRLRFVRRTVVDEHEPEVAVRLSEQRVDGLAEVLPRGCGASFRCQRVLPRPGSRSRGRPHQPLESALDSRELLPSRAHPVLALPLAATGCQELRAFRRRGAPARRTPPACERPSVPARDRSSSPSRRAARHAATLLPTTCATARTSGCSARCARPGASAGRGSLAPICSTASTKAGVAGTSSPDGRTNARTNLTFCSSRSTGCASVDAQFGQMILERASHLQKTALDFHQIPEVLDALLVHLELGQQQRVHGPADDRRLEKRARHETDDRMAVIQRIEVVVLRLRADRIPSVQRHVAEALERHAFPLLHPLGMGTYQDARHCEDADPGCAESPRSSAARTATRTDSASSPSRHTEGSGWSARQPDGTAERRRGRATARDRTTGRSTARR